MSRQDGQPRRSGALLRRGTVLVLSALMVILDQLSKHWITSVLRPGETHHREVDGDVGPVEDRELDRHEF